MQKEREQGVKPLPKLRKGRRSTCSGIGDSFTNQSLSTATTYAQSGLVPMEIHSSAVTMGTSPEQTQTKPIAMETVIVEEPQEMPLL